MASQVLSGTGSVSYTNNTGQNVRVVINFMASPTSISWAGISATTSNTLAIGRNLAFKGGFSERNGNANVGLALVSNNMVGLDGDINTEFINSALPTELMLASGQTFSADCGAHNIVVIPEAG